jgi:cadmium resistance protein CadD (predicted permease)
MISLIALSIALFIGTHVDDLLLLLSFFADRSVPRSAIVCGQYIGVTLLLLGALLCSQLAVVLPSQYLRALGFVPLAIGIYKIPSLFADSPPEEAKLPPEVPRGRHIWGVATLTMASGGDNIGVYLPLFATHPLNARLIIVIVFLLMTAIWCGVAHWLAHHLVFQPAIRRWGHRILPIVLVALGIHILFPG